MNTSYLSSIPPSQSDLLLHSWGFDLIQEYYSIVQHVPPEFPFAVELATGSGRMSAVLAGFFPSVFTGDISLADLPKAQKRVPPTHSHRVQYIQLTMDLLPFRSHSLPLLFCLNTLHEVDRPVHCMEEMIRVIRPEGYLIIGDFNRTGFDTMQRIHETVYHNNHQEGSISTNEISLQLQSSFSSVQRVETPLNTAFIAREKVHKTQSAF